MGSTTSKAVETTHEEVVNEKSVDYLQQSIEGLSLELCNSSNKITTLNLASWETKLLLDPKNRLVQNALAKNAITDIVAASGTQLSLTDRYLFNVEADTVGSPSFLNNQKSSGRCWIFATCNVLRSHIIKNFNLSPDSFQLSQSYLFFYDKLEKANFFLENIIKTADEDLDSRLLSFLFSGSVSDGGQWDMIVNMIEKYGLVPNEVFPDNAQAISTSKLNYLLSNKLREYALVLRKLVKEDSPDVFVVKNAMNREIYDMISLSLGTPPKPENLFQWDFKDKNGNFLSITTTPAQFYSQHTKYDVSKRFSLIHDPRNSYDALYTVEWLNNVYEGKPIEYINVEISKIKKTAIAMLKSNEVIFFGSDVGKFLDNATGILDTDAYDYELVFNTSLKLSKLERLQTGSSSMTHAMVITGVHLDASTGLPVRWKIENSWGDQVGDKGYFVMTDAWFDEYVLQIVTSKKYVDKEIYQLWKSKEYKTLPFYDPMGSLA